MKDLDDITISPQLCKNEIDELAVYLAANPQLKERADLLPFFRKRRHLCAYIGALDTGMLPNKIGYEYPLHDFRADLVIGDTRTNKLVFVEFQTGIGELFKKRAGKQTPEWSPEFEAGFSQLVDWFWKLDRIKLDYAEYKRVFHPNHDQPPKVWAMLVSCRGVDLDPREKMRLGWRTDKVLIDSALVFCWTYDLLCQQLSDRIKLESSLWSSAEGSAEPKDSD